MDTKPGNNENKMIVSLKPFQEEIVLECLAKGSGGLVLPMGYGKTIISLQTALRLTQDPIIIVAPKRF